MGPTDVVKGYMPNMKAVRVAHIARTTNTAVAPSTTANHLNVTILGLPAAKSAAVPTVIKKRKFDN